MHRPSFKMAASQIELGGYLNAAAHFSTDVIRHQFTLTEGKKEKLSKFAYQRSKEQGLVAPRRIQSELLYTEY